MAIITAMHEQLFSLPAPQPFAWGFTTRLGGVSAEPYSSLNLADHVGDSLVAVQRNRQILQDKITNDKKVAWFSCKQVHGTGIYFIPPNGELPPSGTVEADIIIAGRPGFCLAVLVADCVPVILLDPVSKIYGVAHCGWRGTVAHGVSKAVRAMLSLGASVADIQAAIGPAIGPCCFTTGPDVYRQMKEAFPLAPETAFLPNIDLKALCNFELSELGVAREHIFSCPLCTKCHPELLFSYRGSNITGRLAGYVAMPIS